MIRFSKLKLNGFKSFIDRGEVDIGVGLTGIVGPNGCGKSNLVEALRWCMGESSARKMRGSGMDDVIFNGTERRPSRNFAEVTLLLDNQTREAPAPYNQYDEIEIIRRITRDKGSNYRINGKAARARDVQMLFADTMTGANSPALVSQGRVAELINAKPQDRRHVLEESAGVSGLYARRHEAELRLKAAETNLTRLDDVSESMKSRLDALKRQARQAEKYKELNAIIRKLERQISYIEWYQTKRQQQNALKIYDAAEGVVAEKMKQVTALTKENNESKKDLPNLRDNHLKLTSALHSQKLALSRLEDDEGKIITLLKDSREQLGRSIADLEYEELSLSENKGLLVKIEQEEKTLLKQLDNEEEDLTPLEDSKDKAKSDVKALEAEYDTELEAVVSKAARRESLKQDLVSIKDREASLQEKKDAIGKHKDDLLESLGGLEKEKDLSVAIAASKQQIEAFEKKAIEQENQLSSLDASIDDQRKSLSEQDQALSALKAEESTLKTFLSTIEEETLLDVVAADKGFEAALSRALGDTLLASLNPEMNKYWSSHLNIDDLPTLPAGIDSLYEHTKAPEVLKPALLTIGLVKDDVEGKALWSELKPGQSLVSKDGSFWRWDGYQIKAEASDPLSVQLEHKNRLNDISIEIDSLIKSIEGLKQKLDQSYASISQVKEQLSENKGLLTREQAKLKETEFAAEQRKYKINGLKDQVDAAKVQIEDLAKDLENIKEQLKTKSEEYSVLTSDSSEVQQSKIEALKAKLEEARELYQEARIALDKQIQEQGRRKARMHAIVDERNSLKNRTIRSDEQVKKIRNLIGNAEERIEENKDKPAKISEEKEKLLNALSDIEAESVKASDALSKVEIKASEAEKSLKQAETEMAEAREERAAAHANVTNAEQNLSHIVQAIQNAYQTTPNNLLNQAEYALDLDESGQNISAISKRLRSEKDDAVIKREKIGPVNLQAEIELKEIDSELGTILKEREDLILAIEELRKAINTLNAEARARLIATFDEVNDHFKVLFTRLYRGGKAYLELVDSDDALDAGVEIFAQPPGKTLQSLSLMSGGEQTLASVALIFAMFLTNPSPICVLDEVDAPLDDANVDRVCDLLQEIASHGHTRFLVITHHRLTMARMDRLYGVTMAEQGVSQLVSVDLQQELDFLDDAA